MKINSKQYINYALQFKEREKKLRSEFESWLPSTIIDAHTHTNLPQHVLFVDENIFHHMISTFPSFSLSQSNHLKSLFLPNINIHYLRFGFPMYGMDLYGTNSYILKNILPCDRFALCGIPTDIQYTINMLHHPSVAALKMYYWFSKQPSTQIYDFFPPQVLEMAQQLNKPIILHLPDYLHKCCDQLKKVLNDFPKLKIVLAHLGLFENIQQETVGCFREFATYNNIFLDTAMNRSTELFSLALDIFGEDKIIYGSDEPLSYIRSNLFFNNNLGWRLITEYMYHWVDPQEHEKYKNYINQPVHELWMQLLAIKNALEKYNKNKKNHIKQKVFYDNAKNLFNF